MTFTEAEAAFAELNRRSQEFSIKYIAVVLKDFPPMWKDQPRTRPLEDVQQDENLHELYDEIDGQFVRKPWELYANLMQIVSYRVHPDELEETNRIICDVRKLRRDDVLKIQLTGLDSLPAA